ncbi:hypothetical protein FRB90_006993 [Tulasnella sp. 427]|nr:hypothetical protein FRB90_006993 [Tulasnella sp. 427]
MYSMESRDATLLVGAALAAYVLQRYCSSWNRPPLPPGPRPLPLIGNVLDVPKSQAALGFSALAEKYGSVTFLQVPGTNILLINSYDVACELLDKRGTLYADRPRREMMGELIGASRGTPLRRYNPGWKLQRKYLRQGLSAVSIRKNYSEKLQSKWASYVKCILEHSETFLEDLSRISGESVVEMAYGRMEDESGHDYLAMNRRILKITSTGAFGYLVDLVPALQYLPSWLPGMKFKRDAAVWRAEIDEMRRIMFTGAIKDATSQGVTSSPSYTVDALREVAEREEVLDETNDNVSAIVNSGVAFFAAGAETTEFTLRGLLLAMVLFPEAQRAVHVELNRVIGKDRLPNFADREKTPYLRATVLEALRWNPAAPIGIPHRAMEDDIWNGHFIPEGTSVFTNIWAMTRNPAYFPDPTAFKPERHLSKDESSKATLDPRQFVFGFGRRTCPGNDLALHSVWMCAAMVLWAFEIKPLDGEEGDALSKLPDHERFTFGSTK